MHRPFHSIFTNCILHTAVFIRINEHLQHIIPVGQDIIRAPAYDYTSFLLGNVLYNFLLCFKYLLRQRKCLLVSTLQYTI